LIVNGRIARYQRRSTPVTKPRFSRSVRTLKAEDLSPLPHFFLFFYFQLLLSSLSSPLGAARLVLPPRISDHARRRSKSGGHSRGPSFSRADHPRAHNGGKLRRMQGTRWSSPYLATRGRGRGGQIRRGEAPVGRRELRVGLAFLASRHLLLAFLDLPRSSLYPVSAGSIRQGGASSAAELLDPVSAGSIRRGGAGAEQHCEMRWAELRLAGGAAA
jgi:hypothetical protein